MLKSIIAFITVLLILLFALSNVHHIELHFLTGSPFNIRLIYLVLFSFMLGILSASYFFIIGRFNAIKKARSNWVEQAEDEEYL